MALRKLMGQNLRLTNGSSVALVGETSLQITLQGNTEDESNKDTASGYAKESVTSMQWSAQAESNEVTLAMLRSFITAFNSDSKQTIGWDEYSGATQTVQNAPLARSGQAILNDLSLVANDRETSRITLQFQGSGALA